MGLLHQGQVTKALRNGGGIIQNLAQRFFCRLNPLKTYPLQKKALRNKDCATLILRNAPRNSNRAGWQILFTPAAWILPGECWNWDNRKTPRKFSFRQRSLS